ncbi:MAG: hypothetical protein K6A43_01770 [Treponema sp.]|nr:hypothetical protein [Treponema sp.]
MQKFSKVLTSMVAMLALAFCAMSCKVNVDGNPTMYTVTVDSSIEHGKVSVDKTSAEAETTITLTATADEGYELDSYSVKDESSNDITVTDGTFAMPKSNVTVSATFTKTEATLNQEAADAVIAKINAIGEVTYTDDCKAKIDEARTAYNALTDAQKALVTNYSTLTTAEATYNKWVYSEVSSYTLGSEYKGLKITGSSGAYKISGNLYNGSYTFTNTEGKKFKKIEMLSTATNFSGTGVSTEPYSFYSTQDGENLTGKKITWTGSAEEVTMNGYAYAVEYILVEYDE